MSFNFSMDIPQNKQDQMRLNKYFYGCQFRKFKYSSWLGWKVHQQMVH